MTYVDFLNIEKDSVKITIDITDVEELSGILKLIKELPLHEDGRYKFGNAKVWFSGGAIFDSE